MTSDAPAAPMTRKDIEAKIVALAWQDEEFRQKFLADPKAQFEEKLGAKLPDSLVMTAHAEDETHLHFVIPAKPRADLEELSDEDLEKVAGGTDVVLTVVATIGLTVLGAAAVGGLAAMVGSVVDKSTGGAWTGE